MVKPSEVTAFFFAGRIDDREKTIANVGAPADADGATIVTVAYQKFGENCPDHLIGDFAFAIWDPISQTIFAARDPAGCQPVYIHVNSDRIAIAEAIEPLLGVPGVSKEYDEPFIAASLNRIFAHPERTFFKEVRKIKPGHSLSFSPGETPVQHRYWFPERISRVHWDDPAERDEAFRELVQQAVRDRLPVEGKVGVHLSGGLDCSTVTAFAADELRRSGRPAPVAFSWQPDSWQDDENTDLLESEYSRIQLMGQQESLKPNYCSQTKDEMLNAFRRDSFARPLCGGSYGEWMVQREAEKQQVSVILSGWGGDEFASFNGRGAIPGMALRGKWGAVWRFAKKSGRNPLRVLASSLLTGIQHLLLPEWFLDPYWRDVAYLRLSPWKAIVRTLIPRLRNSNTFLGEKQRAEITKARSYINEDFGRRVTPLPDWPVIRQTSARNVQCQLWRHGHLAARIESWAADGAKRGIRYAFPLLDRRIMEFVLSLPEDVFIDGKSTRHFFRQAMSSVLPQEICWNYVDIDIARIGAMQKAGLAAFAEMGRRLDENSPPPLAAYLDLPRLIDDLKPEQLESRIGFGKVFLALQVLGKQATDLE